VTEPLLILRKLSLLREHVGRIRRRRPASADAFRSDVDLQDALAMSLLVAAQEAIDVAMHISADEGWGLPGSYAEAFELLARNGVISAEHAHEMGRIVAVRNRVAHGYASVDVDRLWAEVPAGADCLDRFAEAVARFVEARSA
jgi:uncharacterized protein YutE (UPF0331/DUF86 family)